MKKKVKTFEVPFNFDWTWGVTIEKLRKDLDELEKLGVKCTSATIDTSHC